MELSTLELRVNNTKANIEKTKKTLERHQKQLDKYKKQMEDRGIDYSNVAQARNSAANENRHEDYWLICDYDNKLDDIKNNEKKLAELTEKLHTYQEQYRQEADRQDIPRIPALEDFLARWKVEAADWYRQRVTAFLAFKQEVKTIKEQIAAKYESPYRYRKEIAEEEKAAGVDRQSYLRKVRNNYTQDVLAMAEVGKPGEKRFEDKLEEELTNEVNAKRLDLYYRCTGAVGVITDAKGLYVGNNGSLNGFVVGENGKAEIETILAGGYNIQCLHYRVLVKPIREKKESLSIRITRAEKTATAAAVDARSNNKTSSKEASR